MIETSRRGLLLGLGALVAAPAIVRATSIMPVKAMPTAIEFLTDQAPPQWRNAIIMKDGLFELWRDGALVLSSRSHLIP